MLRNSRDIIRRLQREGWRLVRTTGSHHILKSKDGSRTAVVPHPKKDLGLGLTRAIYKDAGWPMD